METSRAARTLRSKEPLTEEQAKVEAERRRLEAEQRAQKLDQEAKEAVGKEIALFRQEAEEKKAQADRLEALQGLYPDLRRYEGRWKKVVYYSPTVNSKVTHFDHRFNCGCCNDSPLEVWPYALTPRGAVYSSPPKFVVGEKHWIHGATPTKGWKDQLRAASIPESLIQEIQAYFTKCHEERVQIASEEGSEDSEEVEA